MRLLIITGASAGIGLATAKLFRERDYAVVNFSRRKCPLDGVISFQTDLSEISFLDSFRDELRQYIERSTETVLIHNAARYLNDTALNTQDHVLHDVLQTNIVAPNSLNRLCIPHMSPGSSVLFVGSTLAEKGVPNCFSYITSKHSQVGMLRALCQDLAGTGIHTVCICPGFTDTEMLRQHVGDQLGEVAKVSTFKRLIEPKEIAHALFWAAKSPVLNGSVVHANLGQAES